MHTHTHARAPTQTHKHTRVHAHFGKRISCSSVVIGSLTHVYKTRIYFHSCHITTIVPYYYCTTPTQPPTPIPHPTPQYAHTHTHQHKHGAGKQTNHANYLFISNDGDDDDDDVVSLCSVLNNDVVTNFSGAHIFWYI